MENKIIIDANFLVAIAYPQDPHNAHAQKIFQEKIVHEPLFFLNNYLVAEAMTITLLRSKNIKQINFLKENVLEKHREILTILQFSKELDEEVYKMFSSQQKYKGEFLSYVDCSLIVQARKQNIKTIFTFDTTLQQFSDEFDIIGV